MKRTTAQWARKAEADYRVAVKLSRGKESFPDQLCFHCQQSSEKYLKALMEELSLSIPKTHNLIALLPLLMPHHGMLRTLRRGLDFLTRFAVDTRYPGDSANKRQAAASLRWAERVRTECRTLLGIEPQPRKKRP